MPRGLSSEVKAAIDADVVRPVYLLFCDFDGAPLRIWTGSGVLDYDGEDWHPDDSVRAWPQVTETTDLVANNIEIRLSGNNDYGVDIAVPDSYRGRQCSVYIGFRNTDGSVPAANIQRVFSGRMAEIGFTEDGREDDYVLRVESRLVDLEKSVGARYTHQSQIQRWPDPADMGLEYAARAQASLFLSRGEKPDKPFSRRIVYGTTVVPGSVVFVATSGAGSRYLNLIVAFADHATDAIEQIYLDDRPVLVNGVVGGEFADVVLYVPRLGAEALAYVDELETEVGSGVWGSSHRIRGVTYAYLRILYSEDLFGDQAPAVSARIRGKAVFDPRTNTTEYSDNAALIVRDFLTNPLHGFGAAGSEIDDAQTIIAANDCDQQVDLLAGGNEPRYTINGWLDATEPLGDNLKTLLAAMAGKLNYQNGVWAIYAGTYALTGAVITDDGLAGDVEFANLNAREAFNGARGTYRTPILNWKDEDYPPYQNAAALADDGGARWIDLPLSLTTSPATAQRLAKIATLRSRAARTLELRTQLRYYDLRAGDVVSYASTKSGVGDVAYEVTAMTLNMGQTPTLDFRMLESSAADYAWDENEETLIAVPAQPADSILAWTLARLASPSVVPSSQSFTIAFNATVSHNESGVTCRYTLDGSEPTESDPSVANGGTIAIPAASTTLKLKNFQNSGSLTSEVVTAEYTYVAPTNQVPTPVHRWLGVLGAFSPSTSNPTLTYAIVGLGSCDLYNSRDGGNTWPLLRANTVDGTFYQDTTAVPSSWTPSNYRAYGKRAGFLDSNAMTVPNQCIPPLVWRQDDGGGGYRIGAQCFATNCTIWRRFATKSKADPQLGWSTWSTWSSVSGKSWRDYIGTAFPFLIFENPSTWYQWEFYVAQSGFQDSVVIFANAETVDARYGGEGGVSIGLATRASSYS